MRSKSWFSVDKEGLKQLQAGKPKHYIVRELLQNAFDENVKKVYLDVLWKGGEVLIIVEDDSPEGFRDLRDAYTLFKDTYKRKDPKKRGRYNLGNKQLISVCRKAMIETTKGTIIFDKDGRTETRAKTKKGSKVKVWVKMSKKEVGDIFKALEVYIIPEKIEFRINGCIVKHHKPCKTFEASLTTEISDGEVFRHTVRKTEVNLYKSDRDKQFLLEMGIPVTEIECDYSIDVQQKVPLGVDRETVSQAYLRDLFAEVLNNTYDDIEEESSSQVWVREGMCDDRVSKEAVETVIKKRYGDKVCVADPFDPNSVDEAISQGHRVIRGNEMSKEEWGNVKKFDSLQSSSGLFGKSVCNAKSVEPNEEQKIVSDYAKKLAKRLLDMDLSVAFVKERDMVTAQFGEDILTFNITKLGYAFFKSYLETTGLILHEIAHSKGMHTEHSYHECLTEMAQKLIIIALKEPEFFKIKGEGK